MRDRHSIPPTVSEVAAYCNQRNNGIDPIAFIDHYTTNGWFRGKTKIKDWQACVRTWEGKSINSEKSFITRNFNRSWAEESNE